MTSCCFTGHRSSKLYDCNFENIEIGLLNAIKSLIGIGVYTFYTGMAEGIDLLAGRIISELKCYDDRLQLYAAIPYPTQNNNLSMANQELYNWVKISCDKVFMVSNKYHPGCFYERNQFMVDRCEYVIAVYNGRGGGTKQTIDYAKTKDRHVIIIDPKEPYSPTEHITL